MSRLDNHCSSDDVNKEDECVPSSSEDSQGNGIVTDPFRTAPIALPVGVVLFETPQPSPA